MTERPAGDPPPARTGIRGGAFLAAGAVVQAAVGLLSQFILMRLLVPEDFGAFATLSAGCSLVQTVLSLRLNVLIIRAPQPYLDGGMQALYRAGLVWETVIATAITLLWVTVAGLLSPYALVLVAAMAFGHWTNQNAAFFERGMAYSRIVSVETGAQMAGHLAAVALVLGGAGAAALYARELVVTAARLGAFVRLKAMPAPLWHLPSLAEMRTLLAEARGLWADGVLEGGFSRIIILLSAALGGAHGAGIFSQTLRLAIIPHQLLSPVVVRLSANLFARTSDPLARSRLLTRMTAATLAGLCLAALVAALLAEPLIPPILGEHWRPTADTVVAMAGVIVFFSSFELLRAYCMSRARIGLLIWARAAQYAVFLAGSALALRLVPSIPMALGLALSAAYLAAFAVLAAGLVREGALRPGLLR